MLITRYTPFEELPEFLTAEETHTWLHLGRSTLYDLRRRGDIPSSRFGRVVRIPRGALQKFLAGNGHEQGQGNDSRADAPGGGILLGHAQFDGGTAGVTPPHQEHHV